MFKLIIKDIRRFWLAIIIVVALYLFMHKVFDAFCPTVIIAGLPCPGCGLTRSVIFFLTGQWERSLYLNPLGGVVVLLAVYCFYFRYIRQTKVPALKWIIIGLIIAAMVIFVVRMALYFPDRPPYTYNRGNLLERIIPGYRDMWKLKK